MGLPAYIVPIMGKTVTPSFSNLYSNNLDGVDEYAIKSHESALQPTALSYSCWVKTTFAGVYGGLLSQYEWLGGANYIGCEIGTGGGVLYFVGGNGGVQTFVSAASTHNDGNWHHIAGTFNATQFRGYLDGVLVATTNAGQYAPSTASRFAIGRQADTSFSYPFPGKIANPAIIGRVITLAEVGELYALKMGDITGSSVGSDVLFAGYFPNGTADYPSWKDYSGNGYDMTMTNQESGDINTDVPT